jgi:hypothetical protein
MEIGAGLLRQAMMIVAPAIQLLDHLVVLGGTANDLLQPGPQPIENSSIPALRMQPEISRGVFGLGRDGDALHGLADAHHIGEYLALWRFFMNHAEQARLAENVADVETVGAEIALAERQTPPRLQVLA